MLDRYLCLRDISSRLRIWGLISLILTLIIACGASATATPQAVDTPQPTNTPQPTATSSASGPQPTAASPASDLESAAQAPLAEPTATPPPTTESSISLPLRIVTNAEPLHLDWMDGNAGSSTEHFRNSFVEPLTQRISGSSELRGLAAESWEAVDGDPSHWRFKLREDIVFHNGEKFNAQAAATGINFIKDPLRGMIYSEAVGGPHEPVVVDEYTLDIECELACPLGPTGMRFAYFAAPEWYTNASEEERRSQFITAGPFKFISWERGVSLKAEPYENYWDGAPQTIPEATIVWREEDTVRSAMAQAGEVDWAYDVGPQNRNNVPKAVVGQSSEVVVLKINSKNREPFKEPKVRLALRHAIDCQSLNQQLYDGMGVCRGSPFNDQLTGSRDDIQEPLKYDPILAQQLLEEADFFNKWPDFEFEVMTRNGRFPRDTEMFEAVAGMWREIGLNAGVAIVEPSIWTDHSNQNDPSSPFYGVGADIITWAHGNETGDSWFSLRNVTCDHRSGYGCDDWLEPQILPAGALSGEEREEKLHELWKYVYDTGLFPAILELPIVYGVAENLEFIPRAEREVRWNEQMRWLP